MRSSTGRWVSGDDFFDREHEMGLLKDWWSARFRDHHVPLVTRGDGGTREAGGQ